MNLMVVIILLILEWNDMDQFYKKLPFYLEGNGIIIPHIP